MQVILSGAPRHRNLRRYGDSANIRPFLHSASYKRTSQAGSGLELGSSLPLEWVVSSSSNVLSCFTNHSSPKERDLNSEDETTVGRVIQWAEVLTDKCKRLVKFGGKINHEKEMIDGDKYACLDQKFSLVNSNNCLVYSFGINYDWSFDEAMEEFGCEVHSFDPSIDYREGKRSPGITFHHIGIGRNHHLNVYNWSIHTLDEVMIQLGHENRTIQYLKMDVEGGEFDMLAQQLVDNRGDFVLDRVEQIGFELHYRLDPGLQMSFYRDADRSISRLGQLGFNLVHWEFNKLINKRYRFPGIDRPVSLLYEILLVRSGTDKFLRSLRGNA